MTSKDLKKEQLFESVKTLVETPHDHIHLTQQKLYTLFSIAFQFMLFRSTKKKGVYIIRIEDSLLAEKLCKNTKDSSTRKFMRALMLPRKLKYGGSVFYLDFFHVGSWSITQHIAPEKFQGAIIVKNTAEKLMIETSSSNEGENGDEIEDIYASQMISPNFYLESLVEIIPKTITIAYENHFSALHPVEFPFIEKSQDYLSGITISKDIDLDSFKD